MSKIIINSKLEGLFSDLSNELSVEGSQLNENSDKPIPVVTWSWITDSHGIILECGREISKALGFSPKDVIGQPFFSFGLSPEQQDMLRDSLNQDFFPLHVVLEYNARDNQKIVVRTNIIQKFNEENQVEGFEIFSQQLVDLVNGKVVPEPQLDDRDRTQPITEEMMFTRPLDESNEVPKTPSVSPKKLTNPKVVKPRKSHSEKPGPIPSTVGHTAPLFGNSNSNETVANNPLPINNNLTGVSILENAFSEPNSLWTKQGVISYAKDEIISESSKAGMPAVISLPLKLRNTKTGIVEIVDSNIKRKWTEDDKLLVQEVTNQLGLALENAQLYATAQNELVDRVKAEEETARRNTDLAKLNLLMQKLTRLVSRDEIFTIVSESVQDLMSSNNLLLSTYNEKTTTFSFPVCVVNGQHADIPDRLANVGYQESILDKKQPLLINNSSAKNLQESNIDHSKNLPLSLLAVPLLVGDRAIGVLSIFDYDNNNAFDEVQTELLSTVAAQSATALENASLFQEIQQALNTIENRERYQSNVTNAVASLTEQGSTSLDYVLECFVNAANCDKIVYGIFREQESGQSTWSRKREFSKLHNTNGKTRDISAIPVFPHWVEKLAQQGYVFSTVETASDLEKDFLLTNGIQSLLILGLSSTAARPDILALLDFDTIHEWKLEDINILRIASDAFQNTLIREGLLQQVQNSLNETESLYTASHSLALANSVDEMTKSVVGGVNIPDINRGILVMFTFNEKVEIERLVVEGNYFNGIGTPPAPIGSEYLISMYKPVFSTEDPVFYDDLIESDIDPNLQQILTSQNIRSMGVLPLWSGQKQLGVLILQSAQHHEFTPQEMRTFPPLADQLATTIQNMLLFEQTQSALAETGLLYTVSNGISNAVSIDEYIRLVGENALPTGADVLWLLTASGPSQNQLGSFELVGSVDRNKSYQPAVGRAEPVIFDFLDFQKPAPVIFSNVQKSTLKNETKTFFENMNLTTAAIIPLQTSGNPVGLLIAGSDHLIELESSELQTLQIIGNSIAVALERQRLLTEAQRRALELQTAAEIARDTTSTLSLDTLLNGIVNLLKERFGYYHCSIFLMDESETYAVIQESTGEAGIEMKRRRHKLAVGSKSVIGTCTASGEPEVVNDVSKSPNYFPNPLLLETKSEAGIPLKITGKVIGAIDLQSTEVGTFSEDALKVLQILADQVAVAVDNARAYELSQQAVEEMREFDRVKSQFLANMSHELRTPLNSVIGFSRVILKGIDGPINETQEQDITAIYNSGMHLLNMINEILDLSKIEAGKMEIQVEDTNLSDLINLAVTNSAGLIKDKPVKFIQKVPADLPTVRVDEIRISQVLINLISNAIKFTDEGTITIEASQQKSHQNLDEIIVTVTDTGIGIAPEDQPKLFQRFSQVDDSPTRKTGGTGLGLSICQSLIEMHNGTIGLLKSQVGKGSTFYFTLPLAAALPTVTLPQNGTGKPIILSIDDDEQVISLYERFLKPLGYEVIALTDPTLAVEKAIEIKPFAITLDIMMPKKDGWQVLNDLKKDEDTRNIPVLICSILEEEENGFNLGAAEYLVKPFLQDDLANAIQRLSSYGEVKEVMVIDDDPSDLRLVQKMLEESGNYITILAQGGSAALAMLQDYTPDAIILDLFMPDINGFDLLERFKQDPKLNQVPVVILTGMDLSQDHQAILEDFGNRMLVKGNLDQRALLKNLQDTLLKIKPVTLIE